MPKMLISSSVLSLLVALCQAQPSHGLGLVFQAQPQVAQPARGTGDLEGTVTDASGALLPGATVTVSTAGAEPKIAVTDGAGKFRIAGLSSGPTDISVTAPGFKEFKSQNFNLAAGQTNMFDVQLQVAATATNVNVQAG